MPNTYWSRNTTNKIEIRLQTCQPLRNFTNTIRQANENVLLGYFKHQNKYRLNKLKTKSGYKKDTTGTRNIRPKNPEQNDELSNHTETCESTIKCQRSSGKTLLRIRDVPLISRISTNSQFNASKLPKILKPIRLYDF